MTLDPFLSMQAWRRCMFALFCAVSLCAMALVTVSSASGEGDCDDYYFGISAPPDFEKALKCYETREAWEFLILMHLNGEGVSADVGKADELFRAWQKAAPDETSSLQAEALQRAIEERRANPSQSYPRLDYCTDIAGDTRAVDFCDLITEQIAETRFKSVIAKTRAWLSAADSVIFDKIVAAFNAFKEAETRRMYQQYIDGTIRNHAALAQGSVVREHFLKLVGETVEQLGLKPANARDYKAVDDALNQVYRENLRSYTENYGDLIKDGGPKEYRETYRRYIQDYKQYSKEAQLCWIKYRDLWVELARSLYRNRTGEFDPAVSIKTAVTKIRVGELRSDPVR